jgi:hypothetical protein
VPSTVRVTYDAGLAADALSPADKEIVLMLTAHWYDTPAPISAGSSRCPQIGSRIALRRMHS